MSAKFLSGSVANCGSSNCSVSSNTRAMSNSANSVALPSTREVEQIVNYVVARSPGFEPLRVRRVWDRSRPTFPTASECKMKRPVSVCYFMSNTCRKLVRWKKVSRAAAVVLPDLFSRYIFSTTRAPVCPCPSMQWRQCECSEPGNDWRVVAVCSL